LKVTKRVVTCIVCPKGCRIDVEINNGEITSIKNYDCKRGIDYAKSEVLDPRRILTTTVKLSTGRVLPIRTIEPIPKHLLKKAMVELKDKIVVPPVKVGDVIAKNIVGTGVEVIATANAK
jgi:CxxC motif-containing protein